MTHAEKSAGAMGDCDPTPRNLHLRMRFATQLPHHLDDLGHAATVGRMIAAEPAAIGAERQFADTGNQIAVGDELAALAFLQKLRSSICISTVMVKLS